MKITNEQIRQLANSAAEAGDVTLVAICRVALGDDLDGLPLNADELRDVSTYTSWEARAACVDVLDHGNLER